MSKIHQELGLKACVMAQHQLAYRDLKHPFTALAVGPPSKVLDCAVLMPRAMFVSKRTQLHVNCTTNVHVDIFVKKCSKIKYYFLNV